MNIYTTEPLAGACQRIHLAVSFDEYGHLVYTRVYEYRFTYPADVNRAVFHVDDRVVEIDGDVSLVSKINGGYACHRITADGDQKIACILALMFIGDSRHNGARLLIGDRLDWSKNTFDVDRFVTQSLGMTYDQLKESVRETRDGLWLRIPQPNKDGRSFAIDGIKPIHDIRFGVFASSPPTGAKFDV